MYYPSWKSCQKLQFSECITFLLSVYPGILDKVRWRQGPNSQKILNFHSNYDIDNPPLSSQNIIKFFWPHFCVLFSLSVILVDNTYILFMLCVQPWSECITLPIAQPRSKRASCTFYTLYPSSKWFKSSHQGIISWSELNLNCSRFALDWPIFDMRGISINNTFVAIILL